MKDLRGLQDMRHVAQKHLSAISSIKEVFPSENVHIQSLQLDFDALAAVRHNQARNDLVSAGHGIVHFRARRASMMNSLHTQITNFFKKPAPFDAFLKKSAFSSARETIQELLGATETAKAETVTNRFQYYLRKKRQSLSLNNK